ncbi:MAG: M1 family metallopeptidase, partial [bacterium]|nr:M1 family metallopeptidase [bacterium]
GDLKINYWVYQKDLEHARRSFGKTPEMIKFFNKEFGYEYPWAKYDQITIPGIGGGAECTSATLIGQSTIHDEKAEKDYPSHGLVAHEAAHQWWGDLVTSRDWGHTWINESFGTYYDYVYSKHDLGQEEGAINLLGKKNAYLAEARNRYIRPIVYHRWNVPNDNFDSHTYPKGAVVIQMMRRLLGEKPFLKTISLFLNKHAFQPVDTHDFLTAVKEATGRNIDWFFQQWLFKPGHPVFKVSAAWEPLNKRIRVTVAQT